MLPVRRLAPLDHVVHGPFGKVLALELDLTQSSLDLLDAVLGRDLLLRVVKPLPPLALEVAPHALDGV